MYPSERAERRVKRFFIGVIIVCAVIFVIWMIALFVRALGGSMKQRQLPEDDEVGRIRTDAPARGEGNLLRPSWNSF